MTNVKTAMVFFDMKTLQQSQDPKYMKFAIGRPSERERMELFQREEREKLLEQERIKQREEGAE